MIAKPWSLDEYKRLQAIHGVMLGALCAVSAELIFNNIFLISDYQASIGRIGVLFLSWYLLHRFAVVSLSGYNPATKDIVCLSAVSLGSFALVWLGEIVAISVTSYASSSVYHLEGISKESLFYAIPFATGCLMIQAVLGLHYTLVYSLGFAITIALYITGQPVLILDVFVTGLVAALSLSNFRSRSAYIKAGFIIGIVSVCFAFAALVIDGAGSPLDIMMRLVGALLGGILCSFIASGVTPLIEYLGGYVTDMRLIEMATLDHPLLKELSIQAPGTWNHSMVMGMMVESAADAIGANPVLARVGAYFHDIGKMKKPLYFVENQGGGENRHDKLSTSMSALIIRSHVKDGIELARKHGLPKAIEDMIPQHHGTWVIEYFYEKACREAKENGEDPADVDKSLYTYPGPKPQTKEAGLLMLADGIEAAARTVSEPSMDRIQGLVQKMINKVFASGELDECELTLKDLHLIAKCFTRVLNAIYHQRIAYAEPAEKVVDRGARAESEGSKDESSKKEVAKKDVGSPASGKKKAAQSEEKQPKEHSKEDLRRLGL